MVDKSKAPKKENELVDTFDRYGDTSFYEAVSRFADGVVCTVICIDLYVDDRKRKNLYISCITTTSYLYRNSMHIGNHWNRRRGWAGIRDKANRKNSSIRRWTELCSNFL